MNQLILLIMKILRILLYILLVIIAILVILSFIGPKSFEIKRESVIPATATQIWPHVSNLEMLQPWSPWRRMDTTLVETFDGDPGQIGSSYSWESSKLGKGSQTIVSLEPVKKAEYDLKFIMP